MVSVLKRSMWKRIKMENKELINKLNKDRKLTKPEWTQLISSYTDEDREYARKIAREITDKRFGKTVYLRGLIEVSNICKNDCYYCGIRCSNRSVERYRMTEEQILDACEKGYQAGFRTFVMQGGEDPYFTDEVMEKIVSEIRSRFADCAITLSLGERSAESYERLFGAGADRYLLRHEAADCELYEKLHPDKMQQQSRMDCLELLRKIGFQMGCGMMLGAPFQTAEHLAEDMMFMQEFRPHMIGVGPFIPAKNTPFEKEAAGKIEQTLFFLSLCRIMNPDVLLPATTALGTIDNNGREKGLFAGANVIMPNISPTENRKNYSLYDNKIGTTDTAAESKAKVDAMLFNIGYQALITRGDYGEV